MIQINLLEVRPKSTERLDALLSQGGSSTFISRREGLLGGLFLILTVAILAVLVYRFSSGDEDQAQTTAAENEAASLEPAAPAAPLPVQEQPPEQAEAVEPAADPVVVDPPSAAGPHQVAPASQPAAMAAGSGAASGRALTALRVTPLDDRVDIFLEMPNAPAVKGFTVDNPPRLVFDIPDARLQAPDALRDQAVSSDIVSRVRIAQNTFSPPLVRLVLEVSAFPEARVSTSAVGLSISVKPAR